MFCGFHSKKKQPTPKKPEPEPEIPVTSRLASTVLTQKSPKLTIDPQKLECFKNNPIILQNYDILEKIGGGSFGEIYKVRCVKTAQIMAMKIEKRRPEKNLLLIKEKQILQDLQKDFGFPHISAFIKGDVWSYLVMSCLGENLENLRKKMNSKFSLKTVLMIGHQMMERIEDLHEKKILHRDIKPENFVIGSGGNYKTIYIIDFGLSKSYIENNEHIPYRDQKGMVGTARYASINTHLGIEQSRRDDLEAIGYILIYLVKGRLPWQNIYAKNKEQKYAQILNHKQKISIENLCSGLPQEFVSYFEYIKCLSFTSKPDYKYLKMLFVTMMKNAKHKMDYEFDWLTLFVRNSNSNSSMEIRDDDNTDNKIVYYAQQNKNPNNIEVINFESSKKLNLKDYNNGGSFSPIKKPIVVSQMNLLEKNESSLTSSNNNCTYNAECDLKEEECDQAKIQETYNTMKPKLIRSSMNKTGTQNVFLNFRGFNNIYKEYIY